MRQALRFWGLIPKHLNICLQPAAIVDKLESEVKLTDKKRIPIFLSSFWLLCIFCNALTVHVLGSSLPVYTFSHNKTDVQLFYG